MKFDSRYRVASKAASVHLLGSIALAVIAAAIVFGLWYPYPYRELSGGRELFMLVIAVDVVCGPLLTFVLFNPAKPRQELWIDLSLVVVVQLLALSYGVWTTWQARPLYLALEVDRFKVVMSADIDHEALKLLPTDLRPFAFGGVRTVALRSPNSVHEKNKVLFESIVGGRDYAERPEFYVPYEGGAAKASLIRARPLEPFLQKFPDQRESVEKLASVNKIALSDLTLLPVVGRQDWVALLDRNGGIQGFAKGDGF
ncbi:TfpX/TfpZ family type IV pilin accessory protein [Hydrogenophaga sp. RWCD_12]|uniref:TfpX/TfpZ family type IV pilin accessory protein n=1 Tax=Hydrogenophaga sp. RWCD_12 TaxID=3391190 RepID=UPI003984A5CB